METKSRYEVMSELEGKKRELIVERDSFKLQMYTREKAIKAQERVLEDLKEDLKIFEDSLKERKETIQALIDSCDDSLKRFEISSSQKK